MPNTNSSYYNCYDNHSKEDANNSTSDVWNSLIATLKIMELDYSLELNLLNGVKLTITS